ncbi:MAG: hypothetical protein ACT452_14615 [Microthrixaceae bacterium]
MSHTCEVQAEGSEAIVVRRATGPADVAHLRAIGERLAAAAHPGVVEVVRSTGDSDWWELRLAFAGQPVDRLGRLTVEQVAGVAAAVTTTLADLHAVGVVHGRVEASHVLVGPHGRPVLCGFAPVDDPAVGPPDDVAGVGALIVALLGVDAELEPIPDHRWRRRAQWTGWARRSLLLVADQACAEPPTRRPTAARLAAAIAEAVPGATLLPESADPQPTAVPMPSSDPFDSLRPQHDEPPARTRRLPGLVAAMVLVLALGLGAARLAPTILAAPSVTTISQPTTTTISEPTTTSSTAPRRSGCASAPPTAGCRGEIGVSGTLVAVGELRYEVGQPGDQVAVGDWDGDGLRTAAVLRPATGAVFVFSSGPDDADVTVPALDVVRGGIELVVEDGEAFDALVVLRSDGSRATVAADGVR